MDLFSLKMIQLQTFQKPKSRVISDYKISLARTGQVFSLQPHSNACPSRYPSMFHKNKTSLPQIHFMHPKQYGKRATHENESSVHPRPKPVAFKAPDIKEKLLEPDADYIPLELDHPDDSERDADQSPLLGAVRLHSALKSSNKYEDPVTKPLNGKDSEHDSYHSHLLNRRFVSEEFETGQKNMIDHIVKEKSSLQNKGCKRKIQLDERADVLSPRKVSSAPKKVSFGPGANEVSVTSDRKISSDKSVRLPAFAGSRDRVVKEGKEECKLMSLSFAERLRNQLGRSRSRNGESPVAQAGIKST